MERLPLCEERRGAEASRAGFEGLSPVQRGLSGREEGEDSSHGVTSALIHQHATRSLPPEEVPTDSVGTQVVGQALLSAEPGVLSQAACHQGPRPIPGLEINLPFGGWAG